MNVKSKLVLFIALVGASLLVATSVWATPPKGYTERYSSEWHTSGYAHKQSGGHSGPGETICGAPKEVAMYTIGRRLKHVTKVYMPDDIKTGKKFIQCMNDNLRSGAPPTEVGQTVLGCAALTTLKLVHLETKAVGKWEEVSREKVVSYTAHSFCTLTGEVARGAAQLALDGIKNHGVVPWFGHATATKAIDDTGKTLIKATKDAGNTAGKAVNDTGKTATKATKDVGNELKRVIKRGPKIEVKRKKIKPPRITIKRRRIKF